MAKLSDHPFLSPTINCDELRRYAISLENFELFRKAYKTHKNLKIVVCDGYNPATIGEIYVRLSSTQWVAFTSLDTYKLKCWRDSWGINAPSGKPTFWTWGSKLYGSGRGTNPYLCDLLSFSEDRKGEYEESPVRWLVERIWQLKRLQRIGPSRKYATSFRNQSRFDKIEPPVVIPKEITFPILSTEQITAMISPKSGQT